MAWAPVNQGQNQVAKLPQNDCNYGGNIATPPYISKKCITSPFHSWPDMMHESMLCMQKHSWIGHTVHSDPYESLGPTKNMDFFPSA